MGLERPTRLQTALRMLGLNENLLRDDLPPFVNSVFDGWTADIEEEFLLSPDLASFLMELSQLERQLVNVLGSKDIGAETREVCEANLQAALLELSSSRVSGLALQPRTTRLRQAADRPAGVMAEVSERRRVLALYLTIKTFDVIAELWHCERVSSSPKQPGDQAPKHQFEREVSLLPEGFAHVLGAADESTLWEVALKIGSEAKHDVARIFNRAVLAERWRSVLGLDLGGLNDREAIEATNQWLGDHEGSFSDASNDQKEEIVVCLREICRELGTEFAYASKPDKNSTPVTLRCGTNQRGARRFTVSRSGGSRSTISQLAGLPKLSIQSLT